MNPLFLLLGFFGLAFGQSSGSSSTTTTSAGSAPVIDDDPGAVPYTPAAPAEDETPNTPTTGEDEEPAEDETPNTPTNGSSDDIDPPQQSGDSTNGGETTPIAASNSVDVMAGRVATLEAQGNDIASIKIVSGVEHGFVTANPDNTLAVVLTKSDFVGDQSFTYEVTHSDGSTSTYQTTLNVAEGVQEQGWGTGETHYMLETDDDDRLIVETGDVHTKLYISGSDSSFTRADIAAREGLSEDQITDEWVLNSDYGKSEDLALYKDVGMDVWFDLTPRYSETSNWLLMERGYEYNEAVFSRYAGGESELHPTYWGAWGEGDAPEMTDIANGRVLQQDVQNVVIQDIHFSGGLLMLRNDNVILDNVKVTGEGMGVLMESSGITVRNSVFIDNVSDEPQGDEWQAHVDRSAGVYMDGTDGTLWENNFFDMNGWGEGYETGDAQPPSMFSHNLYFDANMSDVTLRDTISIRSSSFGAQIRSGGFIEDNLLADNNAGILTKGGDYDGAGPIGQYTLFQGNVVTYAAYKEADLIGAGSLGMQDRALMTSFVDNIVTHLTDPDDPSELEWKWWNNGGFEADETAYYDDTIVYNWIAGSGEVNYIAEQNLDGLDTTVLDETTIQNFAEQLTGIANAEVADLADYLRAQAAGELDDVVDADLINRFFQEGFGLSTEIRDSAETITFVPNDIGEGVRWDNRLNWETNDLPGLFPSDSVDLGGNYVAHGANTTIDTIDLSGGHLNLYGGRLTATGGLEDDGLLTLEGSGQLWTEGSDGSALDIDVSDGARFANTGEMSGANLTVNDGQAILATDGGEYDVGASRFLKVFEAAKAGFDGEDGSTAILDIHEGGTVEFEASNGDLGEISEFRSGALGDSPDVMSGIDLGSGTLSLNLAGLSAADGASFQLMSADELVGIFDEAMVEGLNGQNARVVIDYENDTVTLELSSGNGSVSIDTVGEESDVSTGAEALWDALTVDQGVTSETQSMLPEDELEDDMIAA